MSVSTSSLETAVLAFASTAAFVLPGGPLIAAGITALSDLLGDSAGPTGPSLGTVMQSIVQQQSATDEMNQATAAFQLSGALLTNYLTKAGGLTISIPSNIDQELTAHPTQDFSMFFQPIVNVLQNANSPLQTNIALLGASSGTYPNLQSQSFALWAWGVGVYLNLAKTFFLVRSCAGKAPDKKYAQVLINEITGYVQQATQVGSAIAAATNTRLGQITPVAAGLVSTANPFADSTAYYFCDNGPNPLPIVDNCNGDTIFVSIGQPAVNVVYTNGFSPFNQSSTQSDANAYHSTYVAQIAAEYPSASTLSTVATAAQRWASLGQQLAVMVGLEPAPAPAAPPAGNMGFFGGIIGAAEAEAQAAAAEAAAAHQPTPAAAPAGHPAAPAPAAHPAAAPAAHASTPSAVPAAHPGAPAPAAHPAAAQPAATKKN